MTHVFKHISYACAEKKDILLQEFKSTSILSVLAFSYFKSSNAFTPSLVETVLSSNTQNEGWKQLYK